MRCSSAFAVLAVVSLLSASAVSGNPTKKTEPKELAAKVGKTFSVTLDENPSTGYQLAFLTTGGEPYRLVSKTFKRDAAKEGMVGVGGKATFTFKATKKGEGTLVFVSLRMFDAEESIKSGTVTTFKVKVK